MKKFELNVVNFDNEDVIATSAVIYTLTLAKQGDPNTTGTGRCQDNDGGANYWHFNLVDAEGNGFDLTGVEELTFDGTTYSVGGCQATHTSIPSFILDSGVQTSDLLPADGDYSYEDGVFTIVE